MSEQLYYKGFKITVWKGDIDKKHNERKEGESWLAMRGRTEPLRAQHKADYENAVNELKELLK